MSGAPPINVLVLCPGGLEHGGGIGRQMGYFLAALPQAAETRRIASSTRVGHGSSAARAGAFPCPRSTLWLRRSESRGRGLPANPACCT